MKYGCSYRVIELNDSAMTKIQRTLDSENLKFSDSVVHNSNDAAAHEDRISQQAWIREIRFCQLFIDIAKTMNEMCWWNLDIQGCEPIQYGIYNIGDHYGWHNDQGKYSTENQLVRKVSMSLFLNDPDEYEGGELDIDFKNPHADPRYDTLKLNSGYAVFFQSHLWHRVRPVRSGVRKSLVAWFSGLRYV